MRIAQDLLDEHFPDANVIKNTGKLIQDALVREQLAAEEDEVLERVRCRHRRRGRAHATRRR